MLHALRASNVAHRLAASLHHRPDPRCGIDLPTGDAFFYRAELILERRAPRTQQSIARWQETRTLRRDKSGRLALSLDAAYRTPLMQGKERSVRRAMRWILVGKEAYISEGSGEDSPAGAPYFYRRAASPESYSTLLRHGFHTLQTLLDALPQGWQKDPGSAQPGAARWISGGDRLVCGPILGEPGRPETPQWLGRLLRQVKSSRGTLLVSEVEEDSVGRRDNARILKLNWALADGSTLHADFRDAFEPGGEFEREGRAVKPPAPEQILDIDRDRSLINAQRRLADWRERAWIKPIKKVQEP